MLTLPDPLLKGSLSVLLTHRLVLVWPGLRDRRNAGNHHTCFQILESSQTLLSVLKREAGNLTKATASEQKSGGKDS